eukprot:scpid80023/ scgid16419/ Inactive ubiquitin carboxyl-terminal hydrolase 54; Inactive ubiquitin-specific peptidase 54
MATQPQPDQSLKGLVNNPGENNCFLNSTVQVLWHLPLFRSSLASLYGHYCNSAKCVFCALKTLFIRLEKVDRPAIPPDVLRRAMADAFDADDRFQLGVMDDAAECYEHLLTRLHYHLAPDQEENACNQSHCITHSKCCMSIFEQRCCGCGEQSELMGFTQIVQYISAPSVMKVALENTASRLSFGRTVRSAMEAYGKQPCSSRCGGMSTTRQYLMNSPSLLCLGVIWNSDKPSVAEIMSFVSALDSTITLNHIFYNVADEAAGRKKMNLVGMVMYYGKHYSSLFLSNSTKKWTFFDDSHVRVLGSDLACVKDLCRRAHYQPLLLVYADPNATAVDFEHAPETVIQMTHKQEQRALKRLPLTSDRGGTLRRSLSLIGSPVKGGSGQAMTKASQAESVPEAAVVTDLINLASLSDSSNSQQKPQQQQQQ